MTIMGLLSLVLLPVILWYLLWPSHRDRKRNWEVFEAIYGMDQIRGLTQDQIRMAMKLGLMTPLHGAEERVEALQRQWSGRWIRVRYPDGTVGVIER